jgi:hypothetical protein
VVNLVHSRLTVLPFSVRVPPPDATVLPTSRSRGVGSFLRTISSFSDSVMESTPPPSLHTRGRFFTTQIRRSSPWQGRALDSDKQPGATEPVALQPRTRKNCRQSRRRQTPPGRVSGSSSFSAISLPQLLRRGWHSWGTGSNLGQPKRASQKCTHVAVGYAQHI